MKKFIKNILLKWMKELLDDEIYISGDIGINETELLIIKYSYRLNKFEVISDNRYHKTPLKDIETEIRKMIKYENEKVCIALDYPLEIPIRERLYF